MEVDFNNKKALLLNNEEIIKIADSWFTWTIDEKHDLLETIVALQRLIPADVLAEATKNCESGKELRTAERVVRNLKREEMRKERADS